MISIQDVSKSFGSKKILDQFNLEIDAGEKIAIIGPSGCGKSTLLRLILGLYSPDKGNILIGGHNINQLRYRQLSQVRMKLGMLFQSAALFDSMSVADNVAFPLVENTELSADKIKEKVKRTLEMVEMEGSEKLMPSDLSGGQKKRIGLARAIINDPSVILYDEPTTGLDPILSTNIEDLIVKLNQKFNATSIVITHQISTILRTSDKIYLMKDKALCPPETPKTIYTANNDYERFIKGGL